MSRIVCTVLSLLACTWASAQTRLYPSVASKPEKLLVLNMRGSTDYAERCLVASAQGLFNSQKNTKTLVYVEWSQEDESWLLWLAPRYVPKAENLTGIKDLLDRLPKGAVLYNEHPGHLPNVATLVSGCDRLLMCGDPELASKYGLQIKQDLRDKFATNVAAYNWAAARYGTKINNKAASFTVPYETPTHNPAQLRDYLVANRIFTFWTSGDLDSKTIGADRKTEEACIGAILTRRMPPNVPVLGYPWSGDGYGLGETDGVSFLSRLGKFLVPTDNFTNLSVWTAFEPSSLKLAASPPKPSLDPNKTYGALVMSDGDNLCTYENYWPGIWRGLKDRSFPIGWTMGPSLRELAPPIYDYAVENMPAGHSMGSGVSGVGYMAVDLYGKGLAAGDRVFSDFVKLTEDRCGKVGESWLWLMRYGQPGSPDLKKFASGLHGIQTIMGGYGRVTEDYRASIEHLGSVTAFHCTLDGDNADRVIASLDKLLAKPDHPRFLNIFLMNWSYPPQEIERLAKHCREAGVELVTPEQLQALERG